jgi:hypothetical protein
MIPVSRQTDRGLSGRGSVLGDSVYGTHTGGSIRNALRPLRAECACPPGLSTVTGFKEGRGQRTSLETLRIGKEGKKELLQVEEKKETRTVAAREAASSNLRRSSSEGAA